MQNNKMLWAEHCSQLSARGVRVPDGFATTSSAYRYYLEHNSLIEPITEALHQLDVKNTTELAEVGARIRSWIIDATMPEDLATEIVDAYRVLKQEYGDDNLRVAGAWFEGHIQFMYKFAQHNLASRVGACGIMTCEASLIQNLYLPE